MMILDVFLVASDLLNDVMIERIDQPLEGDMSKVREITGDGD